MVFLTPQNKPDGDEAGVQPVRDIVLHHLTKFLTEAVAQTLNARRWNDVFL